jgi:hypothetical protein
MNAQNIYAGDEYAYSTYRPNQTFVMRADRLRARKVERRKEFGNSRLTAYVLGTRLDPETGQDMGEVTVRARDVIDFWEDYDNERKAKLRQREETDRIAREAREQALREREERLAQEAREREEAERLATERREALVNALIRKTGMPREAVQSVGQFSIQLDKRMMEVWLSVHV